MSDDFSEKDQKTIICSKSNNKCFNYCENWLIAQNWNDVNLLKGVAIENKQNPDFSVSTCMTHTVWVI